MRLGLALMVGTPTPVQIVPEFLEFDHFMDEIRAFAGSYGSYRPHRSIDKLEIILIFLIQPA